ncbi:MAG: helix-turn-helix transcriptional regulator [Deltaproteobacteria bacterium]|nr:helix-turn-helix transcriptional regulator [Deltaproteobacteria bacterium]
MKLRQKFAQNLKNLRKKKGYTQETLAEKLGISVRHVQFMEGKTTPNIKLDTIEKIAKAIGVNPLDLLK